MTSRDYTRNITLAVIQSANGEHLTVAEVAERAIAAGATIKPQSFSPSLTQWWKSARNGWQFVQRRNLDHRSHGYFFDGGRERKPIGTGSSAPARRQRPDQREVKPIHEPPKEVFAKVVFNEGGVVVAVDQNYQVIKGSYLT